MRDIKFRAWDKTNKVMEYNVNVNQGTAVKNGYQWYSIGNTVCDSKLMQYTEIKDKNGKEIYEGDIIEYKTVYEWDKKPIKRAEVVFKNGMFSPAGVTMDLSRSKIIGNIYENPELLEV